MKTPVLNIATGKTVDYHGEPCLVLEHRKDGTLMLHLDQMTHAFGSTNNFAASSLRAHLNGPYLRSLTDGNPDEIITRTVDLTALNGSKEYGTCECKVAPLTLDELRKYHDILPLPERFEWSVTPWSTPKVNEDETSPSSWSPRPRLLCAFSAISAYQRCASGSRTLLRSPLPATGYSCQF